MFSYLRYFALVTLILVVMGAVGLGMYLNSLKSERFVRNAHTQTIATMNGYTDAIWHRYYTPGSNITSVITNPSFAAETSAFFTTQSFAKITLFSPNVSQLYYGSNFAYVTTDGVSRVTLFNLAAAQGGQALSRLLKRTYFNGSADPLSPHVMIQAIIPILSASLTAQERQTCLNQLRSPRCRPEALAEIYVDITEQWEQLTVLQYLSIAAILASFLVLSGVLIFTSTRAEAIIARQHEINLELSTAAAQAEAKSLDKSQFLASVSHELRTPLNAIIGFSEIIKAEAQSQLQKIYQEYLEDILASGKHLLSLINDILDYSKAEAGKLQIEWAETDATKVIRNSLRMVMPRAETAQVTLVEDVPSHHLVITTDAKKLKQVLLNLLSNAVKFTRPGGEVRCHAWEDLVGDNLVIQVKDTGIGIAPKDISRVMMPFGQVDSKLARKYEGTGLGLPLAKKFVESMGGTFSIESELNVGTTVTFSVPKAPKESGMNPPSPVISEEPDVTPNSGGTLIT